jgi:hypothetical protein
LHRGLPLLHPKLSSGTKLSQINESLKHNSDTEARFAHNIWDAALLEILVKLNREDIAMTSLLEGSACHCSFLESFDLHDDDDVSGLTLRETLHGRKVDWREKS